MRSFIQQVLSNDRLVTDLDNFLTKESHAWDQTFEALGLTDDEYAIWSLSRSNEQDDLATFAEIVENRRKDLNKSASSIQKAKKIWSSGS